MEYDESCSRKLSARNPLIANATSQSRAAIPLLLQCVFLATICSKSDAQRFESRCCLYDKDQRLSQNEVPLSHGHVVRILSVVFTVELEARLSPTSKPVRIGDLHVQHHFMAKPRRKQFRCQSDAIAPLLETSQFLCVLRLSSGSVDHCSWLFQWARILFVEATEVGQ